MALRAVEAPKDVLTTNQWVIEVDGVPRATFVSIDGIGRSIGTVTRADGGTGIVYTFTNQLVDYGTLRLTRMYDPEDADDIAIEDFLQNVIEAGTKINGELIKYHFGAPLFKFKFTGMLFAQETHPTLTKQTSGPYNIAYTAKVDFWEKVPQSA